MHSQSSLFSLFVLHMLDVRRVLEHNAVCLLLPAIYYYYYYIIIYFEKQLLKPKQEVIQKSKQIPS